MTKRAVTNLLLLGLFLWPFATLTFSIGVILLTVLGWLIDYLEQYLCSYSSRADREMGFEWLIFGQVLHLVMISGIWLVTAPSSLNSRGERFVAFVVHDVLPSLTYLTQVHFNRVVLIAAGYGFILRGGTIFVRSLLEKFPLVNTEAVSEQECNMGRVIGNLERLIILSFILIGQYAAIALVFTAKSIARFKELEKQPFADYYLIGTLSSLLVALIVGFGIQLLFFDRITRNKPGHWLALTLNNIEERGINNRGFQDVLLQLRSRDSTEWPSQPAGHLS